MKRAKAALLLASLWLGACGSGQTVEQQIIGAIKEMERYAEEGMRADFMAMVHADFLGQQGSLDRDSFKLYMIMQWNEHQRLHAQIFPVRVTELGDGQASARFGALITGGRGMLPDSGEIYEITTLWIRTGGDWLLLQADWEPARGDDLL